MFRRCPRFAPVAASLLAAALVLGHASASAQTRIRSPRPFPGLSLAQSSHYRVLVAGFTVNRETVDDPKNSDGASDEIFIASVALTVNRATGQQVAKQVAQSTELGDVSNAAGRLFAGTATNWGGLKSGDRMPAPNPSLPTTTPSTTTLPLIVYDGTLTEGVDELLLFPSVWESDRRGNAYEFWENMVPTFRPFGNPVAGTIFPTFPATGEVVFSAPGRYARWDDPIPVTRPIGVSLQGTQGGGPFQAPTNTWSYRPTVIRLRREDLEPYFAGSIITAPNGSRGVAFPVSFVEGQSGVASANYVLWLWVERLP
ncbi:MAG: hypothetical protein ACKVZ0_10675 [Gemmatimonadales bacterium]